MQRAGQDAHAGDGPGRRDLDVPGARHRRGVEHRRDSGDEDRDRRRGGPQTTITKRPAATVRLKKGKKKAKVTFGFTATEASTFACTMDGARFACTSPTSYKLLKGKHVFTVVATDRAGNKDASPATYTVKVKKAKKS